MNIGTNIFNLRTLKGIKQSEIAEKLGLEQSGYSRIEKRGDKISFDLIERIAEIFGVPTEKLLGFDITNSDGEDKDRKIEDLEKRITELEDKIKDKESIISFQADKLGQYLSLIDITIDQYTRSKAREYGLMTYIEIIDEGDRLPLKLKGKPTEVIPFFKRKGITHFQGHITDRYDLGDTIELAFENEFHVAETIYKLAILANINPELLKTWDQVYHYCLRAKTDIGRTIHRAEINHKLIDVSGKPQKVIK